MTETRRTLQLAVLTVGFAISQAYRTVPTIAAAGISHDLAAGPTELALFSSAFHWSFALMQIPVGVALDVFGPRRCVLTIPWFSVAGALVCCFAQDIPTLCAGQAMIGIGCAPALMAAMVLISRNWPGSRFAAISGLVLAAGSSGMLLTSTPLAWVIEHSSWRAGFAVLALASVCTIAVSPLVLDKDPQPTQGRLAERLLPAVYGLKQVLVGRQAAALMAIGLVSYGAAITFRGLWIVPMFMQRHDLSLIQASNVALFASLVMIVAPALLGRLDPGDQHRPMAISIMAFGLALTFILFALTAHQPLWVDMMLCLVFGLFSAFMVFGYAQVRSAFPRELTGRGLTAFNMTMFIGAAVEQSSSGFLGSLAQNAGFDAINAVLLFLGGTLFIGAVCFTVLNPSPKTAS